jgi:tripartite-type tricarboxylate transporter receptor subunit TctC
MFKRYFKCLAGLALATMTATTAYAATNWPAYPIKWIVPYSAGGGIDFVVRLLGKELSQKLGQTIIVENKPGAGTIVGANAILNAKPDGYTIGTMDATALAYNSSLYSSLPYDPTKFTYISGLGVFPLVIAVRADSPYKTLKDLIDDARNNPGKVTCGTPGVGTPHDLTLDLFTRLQGITITHVPYKGGAPAAQGLAGKQVTMVVTDIATITPFYKDHRVRILAAITPNRLDILPDVPTIAEAGVKGLSANAWTGIVGPPGMPKEIVMKLNKAINQAIIGAAFQSQVHPMLGLEAMKMTPEQFHQYADQERTFWAKEIKKSGLKLDSK